MTGKRHYLSGTATYRTWANAVNRCTNSKFEHYSRYGGRGIRICKKWMRFTGFLDDMGLRPDGHELDRIDNNGNYTAENCRWTTRAVNANNKSCNVRITALGETKTAAQWARDPRCAPSYFTLIARVNKGFTPYRAITAPVRGRNKKKV